MTEEMDLKHLEYIRIQSKQRFDKVKGTWIECGKWALPHRVRWMLSQTEGERNNQHIVDMTHKLALRSCVAGFLEGNTSASRPWYRVGIQDQDLAKRSDVKEWLDIFTKRTLSNLSSSNFYHAAGEFYRRGEGFGIKGEKVNGMDIFAVREAASRALEDIRSGNGPYILEMVTYRYRGHSMSDPQKYRTKDEVDGYKALDPIDGIKAAMLKEYNITEDDLKPIDKEVKDVVAEAAQFSQDSPLPDAAELWTDVLISV